MIPISDDNSGREKWPLVTVALIVANILVFLYEVSLPDAGLDRFIRDWGVIPQEISGRRNLHTLFSSMFLHGGWLHIGGNMLFLWIFGDNVEATLGHIRYVLFYALCGLAGGLAQVAIDPDSTVPLVGASGAIAGVLGGYILLYPRGQIKTILFVGFIGFFVTIPAWIQIGLWALLQFFSGYASIVVETSTEGGGVAYFAHIGGFLAGLPLVLILRDREAHQRQLAARRRTRAFQKSKLRRRGW